MSLSISLSAYFSTTVYVASFPECIIHCIAELPVSAYVVVTHPYGHQSVSSTLQHVYSNLILPRQRTDKHRWLSCQDFSRVLQAHTDLELEPRVHSCAIVGLLEVSHAKACVKRQEHNAKGPTILPCCWPTAGGH